MRRLIGLPARNSKSRSVLTLFVLLAPFATISECGTLVVKGATSGSFDVKRANNALVALFITSTTTKCRKEPRRVP